MPTEFQLREYVVEDGKWDEFIEVFGKVVEARTAAGFEVVGVWTVPEERRFVWIVSTDDPGGIEGASLVYYDSPERKALSPEPASFLTEVSTTTMTALPGF